ncbi:prephenate dehydratase [Streptomyces roseirectus]|uniref:prephenate dehydratase n=1 Tax=Streptomyces roseirectus TaxID=2768066 RepID=A0A7H0I968_9ACTN|nr:prephenate dehydratase [Streptomyces roseirectus]QNP69334.1 prephenate dehydratase [Streptomyces roseirectus]
MTYAYLGPEGTFTQAALRRVAPGGQGRPFPTVPAALDAVRRGDCEAAVVPLENSVKGVVPVTMDQLVSAELHITAEVEVPVTFTLMARPGTGLDSVTEVLSHPHALDQCARWLAEQLPEARLRPVDSTAAAAREVAEAASAAGVAAVAAPLAADLYGLASLATGIGLRAGAVTRFVSVAPAWFPPARTWLDRTSLLVNPGDGPGRLVDILTEFCSRDIEVSRLHSWPTGDRLGSYRYFIDIDGHIENPPVREAVSAIAGLGAGARFLGSYPRWGRRPEELVHTGPAGAPVSLPPTRSPHPGA